MMHYNLSNYISTENNPTVIAQLEVSQQEYEKINGWFRFTGFYHTCRSMRDMTLESGTDLENFLKDVRTNNYSCNETQLDSFLTTGNKLLISFLSFIKSYVDVVSNAISNISKVKLKDFQDFNRIMYDEFLGYRFLTRMRNYVIHYNMPLTAISNSISSGIAMTCSRDALLEYRGWSTLGQELVHFPEHIDIAPYIVEAQVAISTLHLKALETIAEQVFETNQNLIELCKQHDISSPIWMVIDDETKAPTLQHFPLRTIKDIVSDLNEHPSYNINITTDGE